MAKGNNNYASISLCKVGAKLMEGSYIGKRVIKVVEKGNQAKQRSSNQQLLVINTFRFHFTESIQVVQDRWQIYQYFAISFSKTKGLIRQYFWQGIFRIPLGIFSSTIIASNLSWGVSHDMGIGICWHLHNAKLPRGFAPKKVCVSPIKMPRSTHAIVFSKCCFLHEGRNLGALLGSLVKVLVKCIFLTLFGTQQITFTFVIVQF